MAEPPYKVVDIFSGAGGFSLGFEMPERLNGLADLGYEEIGFDERAFETIAAIEQDDNTAETFRRNFDAEVIEGDVRDVDSFESWDDADVVVGGPPCQGFSNLNKTQTAELDDERNSLWRHFLRAVEDIDPDVFLIENVPRFLKSQEGVRTVEIAEEMGYTTVVDTLWAHKYGVPQKRKRAFVLGSKLGVPFLPEETDGPIRTVADAIGDLPNEPTEENWHVSRKQVTELSKKRFEEVPPGGNRYDLPKELMPECWKNKTQGGTDLFGRLWWDRPSVTIRTEFYKPEKGRYLHPEANRSITIREGARLQTFPDDFEFYGARTRVAPQIGNAVPPKLSYHLGQAMKSHLEGETSSVNPEAETDHEIFEKSFRVGSEKQSQLQAFGT
ncbi:DNA cytosine methyltransferase [Halorussus salilacus]|uniref:DNA cytosine methyltransferase n=1 Tax=Halorussus salilacus TaxID=2953750 RepID=UPI00209E32A8|nr:DNA cytosine methyltransferase [Halorussus salilacus]USZ68739.1 DNA cytosine methyltransferase [Halorussus salilacus]